MKNSSNFEGSRDHYLSRSTPNFLQNEDIHVTNYVHFLWIFVCYFENHSRVSHLSDTTGYVNKRSTGVTHELFWKLWQKFLKESFGGWYQPLDVPFQRSISKRFCLSKYKTLSVETLYKADLPHKSLDLIFLETH